jgi:hypothetical protein
VSSGESAYCSCKVGRVLEKHDLEGVYDGIVRRREQDGDSLRTLADFVNSRILDRVIEEHADRTVLADAESVYSKLTNGVDAGRRTEMRERLTTAGVPVEEVTADFVSHQTVRAHLNSCLNMETSRSQAEDVAEVADLIEWARNRDERIIDRAIARLRRSGQIETGETSIIHSVRVLCEECGRSYRLQDLLEQRRCECGGTPETE